MNSGQPKIRTQPPSKSSQQDALARLEKLDAWTEEPSRDVAAAIGAEPHAETPVVKPVAPRKGRGGEFPWQDVPEGSERQLNVKAPADLHLKLKWLGDTTYGTNMTQIIIDALQDVAKKMLKERGIK